MDKIIRERDRVLKALAGQLEGVYLGGGTALSTFYFSHRQSYDLDFFTREFVRGRIERIVSYLEAFRKSKIELISEQNRKDRARVLVYSLPLDKNYSLKIDFIEDFYGLTKELKEINGIPVLSIEDIYLRKIFTACGSLEMTTSAGKKMFLGGRQDAKDFFDLYYLSNTFMPLSRFVHTYCNQAQIESIVVWFRTYDRMAIKLGLNNIITDKKIEFRDMERHFKREVEEIIKSEI